MKLKLHGMTENPSSVGKGLINFSRRVRVSGGGSSMRLGGGGGGLRQGHTAKGSG